MSSVRLLLAFSESARHGSFAAAARELGLSPSAVVKSIGRLERELQVRLFQRTTRRVRLTQDGEALFERCRRILDELEELELAAANVSQVASGVLRLDAPVTYGRQVLLPILRTLVSENPELKLDLRLSDVYADVIGSGLDAVVRVGEIADSRLIARVFDHQYLGVYGAPSYLARKGRPEQPADLERHDCVRFRVPSTGRYRLWQFCIGGEEVSLDLPMKYAVNDGDGLVAAAILGFGLVQLPHHMVDDAVDAGKLEEVLARFRPTPLSISLVYPSHRHVPLRLRLLADALMIIRNTPPPQASRRSPRHRRRALPKKTG